MVQQMPKDNEDARTMEHLLRKSAGMNWNKLKREVICAAAGGARGMGLHNDFGV